ncbi:hypothetical protein RND81_05G059600 [Saponaria officinalis]|uniref:Fatty acyl-CoA reductase n=1 Tax=Saponaria officinalis TaxID=3572 RepID=A0AAW1KYB0_SAPOF
MSFLQLNNDHNVGIIDFFRHKTIFITGSTGFMGKVFVEKILRALPTIQKMYLLVRANNAKVAKQRLHSEIIDSELFKVLREKHGESYEGFMWNKIVPIAGDLCKPYFGIDSDLIDVIKNEVNVIVHMGGNTKWHDRHDVALEVNVRALSRLVDFAIGCMKLTVFVYMSSVCVSHDLPGVALEKLVDLGGHCTKEDGQTLGLSIEQLINNEMCIISEVAQRFHEDEENKTEEMMKLALRRSKYYKLHNSYQLSKAMGEIVATKLSEKLQVVIIRPSLVESTIKEPFPGWIEGYKALDPIILSHGMGQLEGFLAKPVGCLDVVPVDMVTNAMIAAIAKQGNEGKHGVNIYNVASSCTNPLSCRDFFDISSNYFKTRPLVDSRGNVIRVQDIKFFESMTEFVIVGFGAATTSNAKLQTMLLRMAAIYEPILTVTETWYVPLQFSSLNN